MCKCRNGHCCYPPPIADKKQANIYLGLGILNFFFPGLGAAILGCVIGDSCTTIIGVVQIFTGGGLWIWAVVYGVFMIIESSKTPEGDGGGGGGAAKAYDIEAQRGPPPPQQELTPPQKNANQPSESSFDEPGGN